MQDNHPISSTAQLAVLLANYMMWGDFFIKVISATGGALIVVNQLFIFFRNLKNKGNNGA